MPRLADITVNQTVLLFAFVVSVLTGVLFGLAPAIQSGKTQLVSALKEGGRGTSGASKQRTRAILTVAEVALAVVLLTGAGLLMRSFAKLAAVDPGFQPSHVVAANVRLSPGKYPSANQARAALDELLAKVRAIPGVAERDAWLEHADQPARAVGSVLSVASRAERDQAADAERGRRGAELLRDARHSAGSRGERSPRRTQPVRRRWSSSASVLPGSSSATRTRSASVSSSVRRAAAVDGARSSAS